MTDATEAGQVPTGVELTALDPAFQGDPHAVLKRLRDLDPIHHDTTLVRFALTRAAEVDAVLRDRTLSVDPRKAAPGSFEANFVQVEREREPSMLLSDPPYHTRLRALVSKAFTAKNVEAMRPRIGEIVDQLLNAVEGQDEIDLIATFAAPLPTIVIAEMLGVDPADRDDFKRWSDAGVMSFNPLLTPEERQSVMDAGVALDGYFRRAIEERREQPTGDLIDGLVQAEESGDRLNDTEVVVMCSLLLAAGNVTTTDLIGNGMLALLTNREQFEMLRDDPGLVKNTVEEMLRYDPPVSQTGRTPLVDYEVSGVTVSAGQSITPMLSAANRDPAANAEPERFDIARKKIEHWSFGGGVHFCLGAPLARVETQVAVEGLVRRFPEMRLAEQALEWKRVPGFRGLASLRVRLR